MNRLLNLTALALACCTVCGAQTRSWDRLSGGLWTVPTNWSDNNAPDSLAESAAFDRFGDFLVTLPASAPTLVDDLRIDRGTVRLISDDESPADLRPAGDLTLGGDLTLSDDPLGGGVRLNVSGSLELLPGSDLRVEQSEVSATSTDLSSNLLAGGSRISATGTAALDLGDLRVGVSGGGTGRIAVDVFDDSTLAVDDLRVGADAPDVFAEVNVIGTTLNQPALSTTVVGRDPVLDEIGRGSLLITGGGSAALGSLVINGSGSVVATGGEIVVAGDLEIRDGGTYSTRLDLDAPLMAPLTAGEAALAGVLQLNPAPLAARGLEAGDVFRVLEATTITGGFDTIDAPGLPTGLEWRVRQAGGVLDVLVVPSSVPGDFNSDASVDAADYTVWRDTFGQRGAAAAADANNDGIVDELDYNAWQIAFSGSGTAAATVPEPNVTVLLACVAAIHACGQVARAGERL